MSDATSGLRQTHLTANAWDIQIVAPMWFYKPVFAANIGDR